MVIGQEAAEQTNLLFSLPIGAYFCDADGVITLFNEAAAEIWGGPPEIQARYCPAENSATRRSKPIPDQELPVSRAIETAKRQSATTVISGKDGVQREVRWNCQPFLNDQGDVESVLTTLTEVSSVEDRAIRDFGRSSEETLRQILQSVSSTTGQEFFQKLVEFLASACQVDLAVVAEVSSDTPDMATTLAVWQDGSIGANFSYDLDGTPCERLYELEGVCHYPDVQTEFPENEMMSALGVRSYIGIPLWANSGLPIGLIALLNRRGTQDVAHASSILRVLGARCAAELERERAERVVRDSEHRLQSIMATVPVSLFILNHRPVRLEYINDVQESILGHPPSVVAEWGETLSAELLHPDDQLRVPDLIARWQTAADGDVLVTKVRLRTTANEWRWFLLRETVYQRDSQGAVTCTIGSAQDITEQIIADQENRKLEQQMQQVRKLDSLGMLAGGIAHDFNNLLASIMGFAEIVELNVQSNSAASSAITEVIRGAESASELTRQLLTYAGKSNPDVQPVNLSQLIEDTSRLLRVSISKNCRLILDLPEKLPACSGDSGQLRQLIMNLILNASDAIGSRSGTIRVTASCWIQDENNVFSCYTGEPVAQGTFVRVDVMDDGCGMDQVTIQKIFDPFYTTKLTGHGLGLSATLGVLRTHGGAIRIESQRGEGTTFQVLIPAVAEGAEAVTPLEQPAGSVSIERTVLLADDEPAVALSTSLLLRNLEMDVVTVSNGQEAVREFAEDPDRFSLVLLDQTMPVMNGAEACRRIRELKSNARVIIMSGYSEQAAPGDSPHRGEVAFLRKPFRLRDLEAALESVFGP